MVLEDQFSGELAKSPEYKEDGVDIEQFVSSSEIKRKRKNFLNAFSIEDIWE